MSYPVENQPTNYSSDYWRPVNGRLNPGDDVQLKRALPVGRGLGNRHPIPAGTMGKVVYLNTNNDMVVHFSQAGGANNDPSFNENEAKTFLLYKVHKFHLRTRAVAIGVRG